MADPQVTQEKQALLDAVPANGEITYEELVNSLFTSGNRRAVRQFLPMRRAGEVQIFLDKNPDGKGKIMRVARPGYTRPTSTGGTPAPVTTGGVTNG